MISSIKGYEASFASSKAQLQTNSNQNRSNVVSLPSHKAAKTDAVKLAEAYRAYNGIKLARTLSFGQGLAAALNQLRMPMRTCYDYVKGDQGQEAGFQYNISRLVDENAAELPMIGDAFKTNVVISNEKGKEKIARTQLKRTDDSTLLYEMIVKQPKKIGANPRTVSKFRILQSPNIPEKAYILNTKDKLMAVVEDGDNMLLTNMGVITKKDGNNGNSLSNMLRVSVENKEVNEYDEFEPKMPPVQKREHMPSIGEGTELIIGLEDGRFVLETIADLEDFIWKVDHDEIILQQFVANPDAEKTQIAMLAAGYATRAEYSNAASPAIFHGTVGGGQTTKGIHKTATGLSPMATQLITLHNAGLLDCSKGKLKLGGNIKLYLNASGKNNGNGGFTLDLWKKMAREGRESLLILPNDAMSRLVGSIKEAQNLINSGKAAMVMIAKKVDSKQAIDNFGIMKLGQDNEILDFAEKPHTIPEGYEVEPGKCLTNTFQFNVSKEAFEVLEEFEKYMPQNQGKDLRDWSKHFVPLLKTLTSNDDLEVIKADIAKIFGTKEPVSDEAILEAKQKLGNQKIYAIPTDEPWADCGSFNDLIHTTMQIASGDFPLEDFERAHVLESINPKTGLVASSKEQKELIESKYYIDGAVMAVSVAKPVNPTKIYNYIDKGYITLNTSDDVA